MVKTIICATQQEWAVKAAKILTGEMETRPALSVVIPAGQTPIPMYNLIALWSRSGTVDFRHVTWFGLDEFLTANLRAVFRNFFTDYLIHPAGLSSTNLITFRIDQSHWTEAVSCYLQQLTKKGGPDITFLGIGLNGHIGFNEPGTSWNEPAGIRRLANITRQSNAYLFAPGDVPHMGITLGIREVMQSRKIVLLARGAHKAKIVRQALTEPPSTKCPASFVQLHPNTTVILDVDAASELPQPLSCI